MEKELQAGVTQVTDAIISALPNEILGTVSEVLSDVMNVIPVLGPFIKAIFDALIAVFGSGGYNYTGSSDEANDCQAFMAWFKTPSSGGGTDPCLTCPSDIFFPSIPTAMTPANNGFSARADYATPSFNPCASPPPWGAASCTAFKAPGPGLYSWNVAGEITKPFNVNQQPRSYADMNFYKPGPNWEAAYAWRPAMGQALMMATEGTFVDAYEIALSDRAAWGAYQAKSYELLRNAFSSYLVLNGRLQEALLWGTYGGVPPARRAQFTALRRAMQNAAPQYGYLSDAGATLWPVYMDLLLDSYNTGQLTDEFVGFCLTYQWVDQVIINDPVFGFRVGPSTRGLFVNQNWFGRGYAIGQAQDRLNQVSVCAESVASQIAALVTQWKQTVEHPATQVGAAKLSQYAAQAKAIASGTVKGRVMMPVWSTPIGTIGPRVPVVKKAHGSAAVLGAAAAAAAIYFFL
jgi:hypothetical protein